MLPNLLILTAWATGVFLAPLLTALPPYRRATWWLWPGLRVAWVVGGGVAAGAATARMAGADPAGMALSAFLLGAVGMVLSVAPMLALVRGPRALTGRLLGGRTGRRLQWVPQAPAQPVSTTTLELQTAEGPEILRLRGLQGTRAQAALAGVGPDQPVTVTVLPALRAFVDVDLSPPPRSAP